MRSIPFATCTAIFASSLSRLTFPQRASQTLPVMKVRSTRRPRLPAIGHPNVGDDTVANETDEFVGRFDDLIAAPSGKGLLAVLSVGGFLGIGSKYVAVPFDSLQVKEEKMVLPGATKDSLKALPEFRYDTGN